MPRSDIPACVERLCILLPSPGSGADEVHDGLVSGQKSGMEEWRRLQVYGKRLRLLVIAIMLCGYLSFVVLCWGPRLQRGEAGAIAVVVFFHVPAASMASALYLTVSTDPGPVPRGFRQAGGRTCTVCHVQKPERCHHCSVCQRCVEERGPAGCHVCGELAYCDVGCQVADGPRHRAFCVPCSEGLWSSCVRHILVPTA